MNLSSAIDPRIDGTIDDGSAEGVMGVRVKSGPLVLVPWREGHYTSTGSVVQGGAGAGDNGDGSGGYIQFNTPATIPAAVPFYIRHLFYGTSYGIRFDPFFTTGGGGIYDFCVIIDRVPYRVSKARYYDESLAALDIQGHEFHNAIVARDLPDGPHFAEINITPQATVNGQRIFGFLADAKYYRPTPGRAYFGTPTPLTTALVTVTLSSVNRFRGLGLRGILYANEDVVARKVWVQYLGATIWSKTIAARSTEVFDPLTLLGINSNAGGGGAEFKHKVDGITTIANTTLTRAGTTATFTASANHNLVTGDVVTITGSNLAPYNVANAAVTVTSATVFTYVMASDPGGSSAGTPIAQPFVQATIIAGQ